MMGWGRPRFMHSMAVSHPPLVAAAPSATCPPSVAEVIRQRGDLLVWLRKNLERAQQRMRASANKHRREVEFKVGDRVLLKLQLYRQHSVARPLSQKLSRRFYGPFPILERIGEVAYRLELPEGSRIHNVFHVSLLRPFVEGETSGESDFPAAFVRGRVLVEPRKIVDHRRVWKQGAVIEEALVEWEDDDGQLPTWEPVELLRRKFSSLFLEDKERLKEGGVDTNIVSTGLHSDERRERGSELRREPELVTYETNEKMDEASMDEGRVGRSARRVRPPKRYEDFVPHR